MLLLPLSTPVLRSGDDLADVILRYAQDDIRSGDIIILSSKAVATVEGAMIDLRGLGSRRLGSRRLQSAVDRGDIPAAFHRRIGRSENFCEAMLMELERLRGTVIGAVPGAALTELRPEGLTTGTILVASAGLDESNAPEGSAIGWPRNPVMSAGRLRKELETRMRSYELRVTSFGKSENPHPKPETRNPKPRVAVIMTDSCCVPRRSGVTAMALVVSGFNPLQPQKGRKDLFGKPLRMTTEAVADQLATAANFLMGNAAQSIPAVIIRDHGLELTEWEGWVPGIEPERDLFQGVL